MAKSEKQQKRRPRCLLIAGQNGAGKTTFAREYLPNDARVLNFVNADLIASGLSPFRPELRRWQRRACCWRKLSVS